LLRVAASPGSPTTVKNNLSQATTIHWHGVRVPAEMDGTEAVQRSVGPGETFEYRFVVPDAGTYWYHSHANETEQLERGLYGALIVRDRISRRSTLSGS
jgi:FtsP/CotA-like multicopper oxidase with cupredoxin domain